MFRVRSFFAWWLEAVDQHSLHSPFFFDLYTRHLKPRPARDEHRDIERLRSRLLKDHREIPVRDLGSGKSRRRTRKISTIAATSLSRRRYSTIYARLIDYFNARVIVELGTSLGINTLYLAERSDSRVYTFEGAPAVADIAALTFEFADRQNIELIVGNIDRTFPAFLQRTHRLDFVFMDANHHFEPTIRYFDWVSKRIHDRSVVVIDDIHHSKEMRRAWDQIRNHRLVYASVDLFHCGILFFDPSLNKQHVILQV